MDSKDWEKSKEADIRRKFKLEVHIKVVLEKKDEMILMFQGRIKEGWWVAYMYLCIGENSFQIFIWNNT